MAKGYRDGVDYSREIEKAKATGASQSTINRLQQERQNKINDRYGGNEPNMIGSNKTYSQMSNSGSSSDRRQINNSIISQPGGTLYRPDGRPAVHNRGQSWEHGVDYSSEAERYAQQGNWDAVQDVLDRRQDKMDATGSNGGGRTNVDVWYELNQKYNGPSYGTSREDMYAGNQQVHGGRGGYGGGNGGGYGGDEYNGYMPNGGRPDYYEPPREPNREAYIRQLYGDRKTSEQAALKALYDTMLSNLRGSNASIDDIYAAQRNQVAGQSDLEKMRMAEMGLAQGLNSGATGQLMLGNSNAYLGALGGLNAQEAADRAAASRKEMDLLAEYESKLNSLNSGIDAEMAEAILQNQIREDEIARQEAARAEENRRWQAEFDASEAARKTQEELARMEIMRKLGSSTGGGTTGGVVKPRLSASQLMDAIESGYTGPNVRDAYKYYFGEELPAGQKPFKGTDDLETESKPTYSGGNVFSISTFRHLLNTDQSSALNYANQYRNMMTPEDLAYVNRFLNT